MKSTDKLNLYKPVQRLPAALPKVKQQSKVITREVAVKKHSRGGIE